MPPLQVPDRHGGQEDKGYDTYDDADARFKQQRVEAGHVLGGLGCGVISGATHVLLGESCNYQRPPFFFSFPHVL